MRFSSFLLLLLVGCSSSHVDDAGTTPTPTPDAATPTPDAGPTGFTSCAPEMGDLQGEPCFCNGPGVLYETTLYRQSIGIEIWDVSTPTDPVLVGHVMERAASMGGLAVIDDHLISVRNLEAALTVYDLAEPWAPAEVGALTLQEMNPSAFTAQGDLALIANEGSASTIVGVDLSELGSPTESFRVPVEGRVAALVIDGDRFYAATRELSPSRGYLEVRDRATGALLGRHLVAEGEATTYFAGLAIHRGNLVATESEGVVVWDFSGEAPAEVGRFATAPSRPTGVTVDGDLLLVGGGAFFVVDLTDPRAPRELGRGDAAGGDFVTLATRGDHAFISNQGGIRPVALRCE